MHAFNIATDPITEFITTVSSPKNTHSGVLRKTAQDSVNDDEYEILQLVLEHISPHVALMKKGEKIKARGLFDPDFWNPLSDPERSYFGKLVVRLVALGLVPLINLGASPRTRNHIVYQRI